MDIYTNLFTVSRFPVMRSWAARNIPKLIICTGITYQNDFLNAFGDEDMVLNTELIEDRRMSFGFNKQGTLIVIVPFLTNRFGLNKNTTMKKFGERIGLLMQ